MGTIDTHLKTGEPPCRILRGSLYFVTGFMSRHEEARIIEPAINVRFYNLIDIAANTADQPDV
jgi:hypothetical protein